MTKQLLKPQQLTQEIVKEFLTYDPDTGVLTWNSRSEKWFKTYRSYRSWNSKHAGKSAGIIHKGSRGKSYICVKVHGKAYKAHRLIWLYVTGMFPDEIDHDDGNGENNKWINLHNVSRQQNGTNKRLPSNNTSGICGVRFSSGKWQSSIKVKQKQIYLGKFDNLLDAACARKSSENFHQFHRNHGSARPL